MREHTGQAWNTHRIEAWGSTPTRRVIALCLPVVFVAIVSAFVIGRHTAGSQPHPASLAYRIDHACRHGYATQDWQARSAHWITVSCENARTGDIYVTGIGQ